MVMRFISAAACAALLSAGTATGAGAFPMSQTVGAPVIGGAVPVTQVQYRGGGRRVNGGGPRGGRYGGGGRGRGFGGGAAVGAGIVGLAAGALVAGALANQSPAYASPAYGPVYGTPAYGPVYGAPAYGAPVYADPQADYAYGSAPVVGDPEAYCVARYRSYDPASGTFLGNDGYRHPCPS